MKRGLEPNNTTSHPSGTVERVATCTENPLKGTERGFLKDSGVTDGVKKYSDAN